MIERMKVAAVMEQFRDGEEHGWETEFRWLRDNQPGDLYEISRTAHKDGIREPIILGNDGRLWDGHHRMCVAVDFGIETVPVQRT